jgi:hypothetical protein
MCETEDLVRLQQASHQVADRQTLQREKANQGTSVMSAQLIVRKAKITGFGRSPFAGAAHMHTET